jgi:hypothetical protein
VLGKLALAYLPFPLIGAPLTLALAALQGSTLGEALGALLLLLIAGVGVSSIGIGLGAAFPRLDWENPRQQHSRRAGLFSVVLYPLYLALVVGATLGLPALAALAPGMRLGLAIAGWTLCLALTAAVAWAILAFGAARLEQLEA